MASTQDELQRLLNLYKVDGKVGETSPIPHN